MSNNRYRRRPKVRYDRIIGVAAIFIVLIIILVSCCKSCGKDNDKEGGTTSSIVPTENKNSKKDNSSEKKDDSNDNSGSDNAQTDLSYSTISAMPNEISRGDQILVNSDHAYEFPVSEESGEIVPIYEYMTNSYQAKDYEISLSKKTILALNNLMDAFYNETGSTELMVVSGYRTKEAQTEDFESGSSEIKGGYSEYHTGMNFSLSIWGDSPYYYENSGIYSWIAENCAKFGFITRYPEEKKKETGVEGKQYQFRYVGIPHAVYMYENNLCLEEYIETVKNYTADGEHIKVSSDSKKYEIYYVPQNPSANTEISVPSDKSYTISGNNVDGFIVTVEL